MTDKQFERHGGAIFYVRFEILMTRAPGKYHGSARKMFSGLTGEGVPRKCEEGVFSLDGLGKEVASGAKAIETPNEHSRT